MVISYQHGGKSWIVWHHVPELSYILFLQLILSLVLMTTTKPRARMITFSNILLVINVDILSYLTYHSFMCKGRNNNSPTINQQFNLGISRCGNTNSVGLIKYGPPLYPRWHPLKFENCVKFRLKWKTLCQSYVYPTAVLCTFPREWVAVPVCCAVAEPDLLCKSLEKKRAFPLGINKDCTKNCGPFLEPDSLWRKSAGNKSVQSNSVRFNFPPKVTHGNLAFCFMWTLG